MKTILIVDDQPERHEGFLRIFSDNAFSHTLYHAWTYIQAIDMMRTKEFDLICLDHDLGDLDDGQEAVTVNSPNFKLNYKPDFYIDSFCQTRSYYDGRDICEWMVESLKYSPSKILIHSWNPDGAAEMARILKHFKETEIVIKPYGSGIHK